MLRGGLGGGPEAGVMKANYKAYMGCICFYLFYFFDFSEG